MRELAAEAWHDILYAVTGLLPTSPHFLPNRGPLNRNPESGVKPFFIFSIILKK
jgi:hypothetical protein